MPFNCEICLQRGPDDGPLVFDGWIDEPWGHFVPSGTAFARAHDTRGACVLELCGPGVLCEKSQLRPGDNVEPGSVIARYMTDGEDIIYDGSACRVRRA